MALLFPLSISLERISHRETPTIKSDLIPWVHIAERQDLCAIFEKEAITTSLGYVEQQTVMKIKAGVKAVDTLVLEDFVCQAAVQERRQLSSPASPADFAIFISCPNIAFRYRLLNGHFRKIQVLFRDVAGYESAVKVLESFDLPMIHKDAPSQHPSSAARDTPSVSTRISMGPPTVFSHVSHSTATRTTPQHRRASTALWSFPYGLRDNNSTSHRGPAYRFSTGIVRPGPSLIEPVIETNDEPNLGRWRSHSDFDIHSDGDSLPWNRSSNINRMGRNVLESRRSPSAIERSYKPRQRDGTFPYKRHANIHFSQLRSSCASQDHDLQDLPRVSQSRLSDYRDDGGFLFNADESKEAAKKRVEPAIGSRVPSRAASSTLASVKHSINFKEGKQSEKENIVPPKAVPKKRQPRKIFKTLAVQTESSSISKSTQTHPVHSYISKSIQTEPIAVLVVSQNRTAHTKAPILNSAAEVFPNTTQALDTANELCDNPVCFSLPKKCQLPINKFGQGRKRVPASAQKVQNTVRLKTRCEGDSHANTMLPQRSVRGINKFGRARIRAR